MRLAVILMGVAMSMPVAAWADGPGMIMYNGGRFPIYVDGGKYIVGVHKKHPSLLLQQALENNNQNVSIQTWRQVAEKFVMGAGCGISSVEAISTIGGTWRAHYVCPQGVSLPELVKAQKDTLKGGGGLTGMGSLAD